MVIDSGPARNGRLAAARRHGPFLSAGTMYGRVCSPLEERINAWTHALGLLASLAALPLLIQFAARRGDGLAVLGMCVFGISLVGAYAASTMYHSVRPGPLKDLWLRVDYAAIYVLIAGTYTPFTLGAL